MSEIITKHCANRDHKKVRIRKYTASDIYNMVTDVYCTETKCSASFQQSPEYKDGTMLFEKGPNWDRMMGEEK